MALKLVPCLVEVLAEHEGEKASLAQHCLGRVDNYCSDQGSHAEAHVDLVKGCHHFNPAEDGHCLGCLCHEQEQDESYETREKLESLVNCNRLLAKMVLFIVPNLNRNLLLDYFENLIDGKPNANVQPLIVENVDLPEVNFRNHTYAFNPLLAESQFNDQRRLRLGSHNKELPEYEVKEEERLEALAEQAVDFGP